MKELFWDLLTSFFFLINLKMLSPVKPSLKLVMTIITAVIYFVSNLIFFLFIFVFWSIPSDFKSSFKLRKGHFPQFSSEKLPSPTESHSPGVKRSHARTSGPIGKSLRTLALVGPIYHKSENAQSLQKGGHSVHTSFLKGEQCQGAEV